MTGENPSLYVVVHGKAINLPDLYLGGWMITQEVRNYSKRVVDSPISFRGFNITSQALFVLRYLHKHCTNLLLLLTLLAKKFLFSFQVVS